MFGHILLLLVLFDNEFHRIAYGQVGEIALDVLAMEKEVVVGVFDETETAFKAEDFAYFYRVFRLRGIKPTGFFPNPSTRHPSLQTNKLRTTGLFCSSPRSISSCIAIG